MERKLFGFIWRYSKRQQLVILGLTVISFPILYMTLELPKWIVNDAIEGSGFPKQFLGLELEQIPYLLALCLAFLSLVVLNNVVKYILNMTKGVAGERMLRRLRYMLYHATLRFRLQRFRRVSGGEIIPMITAEVEDVGVFIGEAIATPAFQGGTLLVYITFIFAQDPYLGAAAISLYPLQAYIIPKLQQRVIMLTRERVKNIRVVADRIGETVAAAPDIHANATAGYHLADISDRLFTNYKIRLAIYKRKFMIKFLNNFMNQLPPFFFYSVGGYLVINGSLSFGALVAVLAAYKDLASPWKELLNWYQNLSNVSVKYETVVEAFDVDDAMAASRLPDANASAEELTDLSLRAQNVSISAGGSTPEVEDATIAASYGTQVAVFGRDGSGRSELLMALAGLYDPTSGTITLGERRLEELSEVTIANHISLVPVDPYVFNDTIRANVVYGISTQPVGDPDDDLAKMRRLEAMLTGNSLNPVNVSWANHERAGLSNEAEIDERLLELFEITGLASDVYRLGLASHLSADDPAEIRETVLAARAEMIRRVSEDKAVGGLVELWSAERINQSATVGENVLFAIPTTGERIWECTSDPAVRRALDQAGLSAKMVEIGGTVAETMIELFADTGADASLIGDFSFLGADELPLFEDRLRTLKSKGADKLDEETSDAFISLAFRVIPARHRIVSIEGELAEAIVAARPLIRKALDGNTRFAFFDAGAYIDPLSIEENVLFGKPRADRRGAREKLDLAMRDTVEALGLRTPIARAGLGYQVGVAGGRLSASQRRRIGLARALLKTPQIIIIDGAADGDPALVERIKDMLDGRTLIVGTADPRVAKLFGSVAVMRESELVATGPWSSVGEVALGGAEPAQQREAS